MTECISKIDLVYLWVNGNDPEWQKKHDKFTGGTKRKAEVDGEGRYADNDELKYSLRSVEAYAPWINRIFIVTDNQVPAWLDTSNPRIRLVDHSEIMPEVARPSFNSSVIEHFICRIPDLSEHYLYANDDMYFNRPAAPSDFFAPDGLPILRMNRRPFRKLLLNFRKKIQKKPLSHYNTVVQNAALLVEQKFGKYYGAKAHHNIDAYLKSHCLHVEQLFKDELEPTFSNHVRTSNDVQRSLYYYTALAEKCGHLRYVTQKESLRVHIQNKKHYKKFDNTTPLLFCMNDSEYARNSDRLYAAEFLQRRFPVKSEFEKP